MSYISAIRKKDSIIVWERNGTKRTIKTYPAPFYFYTKDKNGEYKSIFGEKLKKHEFSSWKEFYEQKNRFKSSNVDLYESDISPELKVLSEHYYQKPAPKLNMTFFDIEVDYDPNVGYASIENPYAPINSIAFYNSWQNRMMCIAVPPKDFDGEISIERLNSIAPFIDDCDIEILLVDNEKELLDKFLDEIDNSDLLSGWNSQFFDIPYLAKRLEKLGKSYLKRLTFPEANTPSFKEENDDYGGSRITLSMQGRISADYLAIFKKYEVVERHSFKLESVADDIIVDKKTKEPILPKLEYEGTLADLYQKDFEYFIRYNIRDTEILKKLEDILGYIELANQMCHISTALFEHVTGTLKLSELATINYCHHDLNNLKVKDSVPPEYTEKAKGAFVLLPQVGEHKWIGAIDINSLYPSVIRSINISPETIVGQFKEKEEAFKAIRDNSEKTINLEIKDKVLALPAKEWKKYLKENKLSISGYGTVFIQTKTGIMPSILASWYKKRKEYQKMSYEAEKNGDLAKAEYYDKLQYVYKIKLNSYYGSLLNSYFRFYDKRLGESVTATSRYVLLHQCAKVAELLDKKYINPDREVEDDKGEIHIGYNKDWSVIYGDSVAKDTKIILEDGKEYTIESLFKYVQEKHNNGKEYYFPKNIKALTYDKSINKTVFEEILYVMRHKTTKKMYRVWLTNSTYVDVTEDHSLIGYKNTQKRLKDESCLVEVKPHDLGNEIKSLIFLKNIPRRKTNSMDYPKEIYEFLGMIIGDGYLEKKKSGGIGLSIGKEDIEVITEELLNPLKEMGFITSYHIRSNEHDVRICGTKIYDIVKDSLYYNDKKQFPEWIFDETVENICHFLRGYFSADGTVSGNNVSLSSINLDFIENTQKLLFYCGIASNYFTENNENCYNSVCSGTYTKKLTIKSTEEFKNLIGFIQERKQNKIPKIGKEKKYLAKYDFTICRKIYKVEEIKYDDYVYDIEVNNTHVFFANNILVHNTDSTYFKTHAKNKEEAIEIADLIGEITNKSFPKFMESTFLCNEGYKDIIKTGREIVSTKGIFVDKKRYFLHIADKEGIPQDKIKVMGLDTKKTTLPKEISKDINKFIEKYLKGEKWENIEKEIVDYKENLMDIEDIWLLGLPKGVKKVEYYTQIYESGKKQMIPGHVMASIHYNKCLEKFNDKISPKITSGMKIKVFYLKKQIGRFKAIALPTDLEAIPEWFLENFKIDRKAHIKRLIDDPLNNIIKAIGKDAPSKQSLFTNSVLEF